MINQSLKLSLLLLININFCKTYSQIPKEEISSVFVMKTMTYKTIDRTELKVYIYRPVEIEDNEKRPAIIFFSGEVLPEERLLSSYRNVNTWLSGVWLLWLRIIVSNQGMM